MIKKFTYVLLSLNLFTFLVLPHQGYQTICLRRTRQIPEEISVIADLLGIESESMLGVLSLSEGKIIAKTAPISRFFSAIYVQPHLATGIRKHLGWKYSTFKGKTYIIIRPDADIDNVQASIVNGSLLIQIPEVDAMDSFSIPSLRALTADIKDAIDDAFSEASGYDIAVESFGFKENEIQAVLSLRMGVIGGDNPSAGRKLGEIFLGEERMRVNIEHILRERGYSNFSGDVYIAVVSNIDRIQAKISYADKSLLIMIPYEEILDFEVPYDLRSKVDWLERMDIGAGIDGAFNELGRIIRGIGVIDKEDLSLRLGASIGAIVQIVVQEESTDKVIILLDERMNPHRERVKRYLNYLAKHYHREIPALTIVVGGERKVQLIKYTIPEVLILSVSQTPFLDEGYSAPSEALLSIIRVQIEEEAE